MPTYVYACTECDHRFEAQQAFTDNALTECPNCGGKLRKVFNSVGIVFKGSGFYRNDSRGSEKSAAASSSSGSDSSGSSDSSSGSASKSKDSATTSAASSGSSSSSSSSAAGSSTSTSASSGSAA